MLGMYESTYFPKDFNAIPNVVTAWAGPRLATDPFVGPVLVSITRPRVTMH